MKKLTRKIGKSKIRAVIAHRENSFRNELRLIDSAKEKKIGKSGHVYVSQDAEDLLYHVGHSFDLARKTKTITKKGVILWSGWAKNTQEVIDEINRMFSAQAKSKNVFYNLTTSNIKEIDEYVSSLK